MRYYILFVYLFITILSWGQAPLIGAYYFDGWAGNNKKVNEKWAQNAPTHLTKELALTFNSRQPIWGWRDDKLEIMEKQIDIAAKNGIDFFLSVGIGGMTIAILTQQKLIRILYILALNYSRNLQIKDE